MSFVCYQLGNDTVALAHYNHYNDAVSVPSTSHISCVYLQMKAHLLHSEMQVMLFIVLVLLFALKFLLDPVRAMSCHGCLCYLGCGM